MDRGILSTIYVRPASGIDSGVCQKALTDFFADSPCVRVVRQVAGTKSVAGTNFCDISAHQNGDRIVLLSALDNLIKGAAGTAVQNFNLMYGYDPTLGLI